jgi:uncharacterized protein
MTMISLKIYHHGDDLMIGACDEQLIGKTFKEGKFQLCVDKKFYDGERVDPPTLRKLLRDATIANLVGKETVKVAMDLGLVEPNGILHVKGIPHAQIVCI